LAETRPDRKQRGGSIDKAWEDRVRLKIQSSKIVNRLIDFVNGKIKLEPHQVTAGVALARKVLPDLSSAENKTTLDVHFVARIPDKAESVETWQDKWWSGKPSQPKPH
jgi:predicted secreted protein